MKKEDLRKLYKEEKPGLNLEVKVFKILFLIFFLLTFKIYSQIPINTFCRYNSSEIDTGFNSILSYPNENNSQSKLLLYSNQRREAAFYDFTKQGKIELQNFLSLRMLPSNIMVLNKSKNTFVYSSRKARKVGIFKIIDNRKIFFTSSLAFNSYPENLSVADVNNDGKNEILVSGSAFNGLSILFINNNKIFEKKLVQDTIYPNAVFADINSDSLYDIVAFNLLRNSLDFFYNQGDSTFYKARSIDLTDKINNLYTEDLNKDSYPDIIYSESNSIHIIYGDFRNSYSENVTLNTYYNPDKIIFGDFNNDGKSDIAYFNFSSGIISIFYGKGNNDFYKELVFVEKKNLSDIAASKVKSQKALFGLTRSGELFSISSMKDFSDNSKIILTPGPRKISLFNHYNTVGYCLIDSSLNQLKVALSDMNAVPVTIYSLPLMQNETNVLIRNLSPTTTGFFCYSKNQTPIEFYTVNFHSQSVDKRAVYTNAGINDLDVSSNQNKIASIIYTYQLKDKFGVAELVNDNNKFQEQKIFELDGNLISSKVSLGEEKVVYFWIRKGDNFKLYKKQLNDPYKESLLLARTIKDFKNITNLWVNISNKNHSLISLINAGENSLMIFRDKNKLTTVKLNRSQQLFLGGDFRLSKSLNLDKIFGYSSGYNTFYEFHSGDAPKENDFQKVIGNIRISDFVISRLATKNQFLIYLQDGSVINFRKLF
jgi:FG-GAP-like repeat